MPALPPGSNVMSTLEPLLLTRFLEELPRGTDQNQNHSLVEGYSQSTDLRVRTQHRFV